MRFAATGNPVPPANLFLVQAGMFMGAAPSGLRRLTKQTKCCGLWGPIVVLPVDSQTSRLYTRTFARPSNLCKQLTYDRKEIHG